MPIITHGNHQVHVIDEGEGPAVVLLHAFPLHSEMWRDQVEHLAALGWRALAIDLPGFGGSPPADRAGELAACSIDGFAALIEGVMRELDVGPSVVAGVSMGGYASFALVRRNLRLVKALVLCDTKAESDDTEARERRSRQQAQLEETGDTAPLADDLLDALLGPESKADEELVERVRTLMRESTAEGWRCALEAMKGRPDSSPTLPNIPVPTLVAVGEHDTITPPAAAESMAERIPGARLEQIPRAGHLANLENPKAFNAAFGAFLDVIKSGD